MAAYLIALANVEDPETYAKIYAPKSAAALAQFGGEILARGGTTLSLEGQPFAGRAVIVRFPSLDRIREFYNSPAYREAKVLREGIAYVQMIGVEGVAGSAA